eukprot:391203_1
MSALRRTFLTISCICLLIAIAQAQHDHEEEEHETHEDDHAESDTMTSLKAVGITTFAGCAAFIGFFSIFCIKKERLGVDVVAYSLAFSSGVICHLSFINLIPECVEQLSTATSHSPALVHFFTLLCVTSGIVLALGMEAIFKHFNVDPHHHHHHNPPTADGHLDVPATSPPDMGDKVSSVSADRASSPTGPTTKLCDTPAE